MSFAPKAKTFTVPCYVARSTARKAEFAQNTFAWDANRALRLLESLEFFVDTARAGTFSTVARHRGLTVSSVPRQGHPFALDELYRHQLMAMAFAVLNERHALLFIWRLQAVGLVT